MLNKIMRRNAWGIMICCTMLFISLFSSDMKAYAEENVVRNRGFLSIAEMEKKTGSNRLDDWQPKYLTKIEQDFWNFAKKDEISKHTISTNLASNAYQNLESFLDNGYVMDYNVLKNYMEDYKQRAGREDAYYLILKDCLNNPYLLNRPKAIVTATTYNGRDYSKVFDAEYYYTNNPDLQSTIGKNPAELLRHFVECGVNEGRRGSAAFSITDYAASLDANVKQQMLSIYGTSALDGVGRYSYSLANYYGYYLGHYNYENMFADYSDEMY